MKQKISAILLCAGFGTRLKPLTLKRPKPLLPVGGVPMLVFNLILLKEAGFKEVTLNLYHHGEAIEKLLQDGRALDIKIHYSWEKKILGTAGGVRQVLSYQPASQFLVLNGDVLSDIPLKQLIQLHQHSSAKASLVAIPSNKLQVSRYLYYQNKGKLLSISQKAPHTPSKKGIFAGVQIINRDLIETFPLNKKGCLVQNIYDPALARQDNLQVMEHQGFWEDLGSLEKLKAMDRAFYQKQVPDSMQRLYKKARQLLF
ncbi:MAG: nucleotidyltransferase family protein [Deltaproteobacteria bacterium]|nr:nucleotidyltransferase family protein [Deltaproteobacteria bacterium]